MLWRNHRRDNRLRRNRRRGLSSAYGRDQRLHRDDGLRGNRWWGSSSNGASGNHRNDWGLNYRLHRN